MQIRAYRENDLPQIFGVYAQSKLDELRFEKEKFILLPLDQDTRRLNQLMESNIFLYHEGDEVYGYGALFGNEIRALFVRPKWRGKGVGKSLLEFLLSHISGESYLYVASTNYPAKSLYMRYGFNVTKTFETVYNQRPVLAQKMVRYPPKKNI